MKRMTEQTVSDICAGRPRVRDEFALYLQSSLESAKEKTVNSQVEKARRDVSMTTD